MLIIITFQIICSIFKSYNIYIGSCKGDQINMICYKENITRVHGPRLNAWGGIPGSPVGIR